MAFWGTSFRFNSIPCETYDLMMYDVGSGDENEGEFASTVSIDEETVGRHWKPYFYGVQYEKKLEFEITFGVNQQRLDEGRYLTRQELSDIASWLTGHEEYLWLEIDQEDLQSIRYHCMITELSIITYGNVPWALQATVTCDSPFAYQTPKTYEYEVDGQTEISFDNKSCLNGYYMPELEINTTGTSFKIKNLTDNGREVALENFPAAIQTIYMDNEHGILTNDQDLNLYPYFNYKFFRLKRGENKLEVTGNGTLKIKCSFPINVGG